MGTMSYAISEICWLAEEVFESASVNTLITLIQRCESGKTKVRFFEILSDFPRSPVCERTITQKSFVNRDYYISIFSSEVENAILDKILKTSRSLGEIAHPCSGYNPYEVGAGIAPEGGPHTKKTVKDKPYHSERQKGQHWKPEVIGRDLDRFHVQVTRQRWIKYGPWLAAPRNPENFTGKRILVQEITGGRDKRIVAAYYEGELYHSRDVIPIKLIRRDPHPFFLLGVINSWLISWYHHKCNPKAQKGLFPKVLVSDLKKLPIHCVANSAQHPIVKLVERILEAKTRDAATDTSAWEREIDQMVYHLYGLTEEEIKIVEGETK